MLILVDPIHYVSFPIIEVQAIIWLWCFPENSVHVLVMKLQAVRYAWLFVLIFFSKHYRLIEKTGLGEEQSGFSVGI